MKWGAVAARLVMALISVACLSQAAVAQTYSKKDLQDIYLGDLAREGYRAELTPSGNLRFKREGKTYLLYVDERDPAYFRLLLNLIGEDKSAPARARRLEAANLATRETKVVKVYVDSDGDPTFAVEALQAKPGDSNRHLMRYFDALDLAYQKYLKTFRESGQ